ncbi:MAG TPA: hypothetical protein VIL34_07340 [Actinopolymorphaceae bacterium]
MRLGDSARIEDALAAIESVLGSRGTVTPEAARITAPMTDPYRVTDLLVALRERGIQLTELSVQKPTLDEVFLTLTGHGVEPEVDAQEAA